MQQAISLLELNQIIRDSLENNLSPSYWVIAEIGELKLAAAGHAYLELVEKNGNQVKAKIRANIWQYSFRTIAGRFQAITGKELRAGMKVLALATVTFHELYGISLTIKDIDPNYTLGERARIRQEIIDRLRHEGMMELNKRFELPSVPQRIAVISSQTAAGYGDFVQQLQSNRYGYQVHFKLYPATLQGSEAAKTMIRALEQIEEDAQEIGYDMVIIIRGGGAQMDLDCFDDYDLALAIAKFPIPILTGIGHERDETIADLVAHTKVKTPTAAAEFILSGFLGFEEELLTFLKQIERQVSQKLLWEDRNLRDYTSKLKHISLQKINWEKQSFTTKENQIQNLAFNKVKMQCFQLEKLSEIIKKDFKGSIQKENQNLDSLEKAIKNLDPISIFEKGYSRSEIDGKPIHSTGIREGMEMVTITKSKKIKSTIQEIEDYGK
ncbi:exodeoxyribonuclease VII large subunit [Belliella aquatica]|uniref:Exodeoxyribonuclease 7 large subunit n=1 Tax=Belliella aquatica TaxID=1323734 RepID=A0ABQ1MXN7_9BACT|nr:exodeoxyribonuclease VII large subunit [Belliella aquatica]MCH7406745.1 exodeoxyribonuclease VII large subunit [Belliella aquatica]GGC48813.1 exodeoxyribonuclease 7 large subunit [Belliella aquatica]